MTIDLRRARIQLSGHQPLSLTNARGTRLRAVAGTSWVTIDRDRRDWVLEPGDDMVVDSTARVLLTCLGTSATVDVCTGARAAVAPRRLLIWLARAWPGARAAALGGAAG